MEILVIGATGFIGSRVVDYLVLEKRARVRALVRDYRKGVRIGRLPVEFYKGSADDFELVRKAADGCDAIICCAHPFSYPDERSTAEAICSAAISAARLTTTRRIVFISSAAVYGLRGGVVDEETKPEPDTSYGKIKLRCEKLFLQAHNHGHIRSVILRPFIVYGPFGHAWTIRPVCEMLAGWLVLPRNGEGWCNAIYVDDVARATGEAVASDRAEGTILNLSGPVPVSWKEFYSFYERSARPGSLLEVPLTEIQKERSLREEAENNWNSMKRAVVDPAVRSRLNGIPFINRLNRSLKLFGWVGLPQAREEAAKGRREWIYHFPGRSFLNLYMKSPKVENLKAHSIFNFTLTPLSTGMERTIAWLQWAGLKAEDFQEQERPS